MALYGQLGIATPQAYPVCDHPDVGADDRQASREPGDRAQEIAKQNGDTVGFYQEPDKRPLQQYQDETGKERCRAFSFLFPRKEEERLLRTDDDRQPNEKKDISHRQHGPIKEQHHSPNKKEATTRAENHPNLLVIRQPHGHFGRFDKISLL